MIHLEPLPPPDSFTPAAPLDAYVTAKPDEPVFTLQGGDPLAAPLVRLWAWMARGRAGICQPKNLMSHAGVACLIEIVEKHSVADDERERDNLLLRATAAEQVSWAMDDYVKGNHGVDRPSEAEDTHLTELQRIDLHDLKVRAAQKLSNHRSEVLGIREALIERGYEDAAVVDRLIAVEKELKALNEAIEPRRIFKS